MSIRLSPRVAWSAVGVVALVATVGGIASASIPDSNGVIHGCYATKDGTLRLVDPSAGQSCDPKKEGPVTWNAQGPAGPPGSAGSQGPPGPSGSTHGYETNAASSIKTNTQDYDVISISGVPDGSYLISTHVDAFSIAADDIAYCTLYDGTSQVGNTVEDGTGPESTADLMIVGAVTLSGGSSTVHVDCESLKGQIDTYSALSLERVAALN
jgi:hypothetical protein